MRDGAYPPRRETLVSLRHPSSWSAWPSSTEGRARWPALPENDVLRRVGVRSALAGAGLRLALLARLGGERHLDRARTLAARGREEALRALADLLDVGGHVGHGDVEALDGVQQRRRDGERQRAAGGVLAELRVDRLV